MKIEKSRSVAFSGHRSFKAAAGADLFADPADGDAIRARLSEALDKLAAQGHTTFLCGMAEGFDLMAGQAVLELRRQRPGVRLIAVVPFAGHRAGHGPEIESIYNDILSSADHIVTVCPRYSTDSFHRRNDYLTDNASVLVCYYNGTKGGTAYTVKRALRSGLRIVNLY